MKILPRPRDAYRELQTWSVAVGAMYEDGYPAEYILEDRREPSEDELASRDFLKGKVFNGRCQYAEAVGPWIYE